MQYYNGRFLEDSLFGLFLYNTIQRYKNNSEGNFFFKSDRFIGRNPPAVQELKKQPQQKNTHYIQMLRHFSRDIKGSDNYWRSRIEDLQHWIMHHVARGHAPPTFFITLSCAENWWIDLRCLLAQLEDSAQNYSQAEAIRGGSMIATSNASRIHKKSKIIHVNSCKNDTWHSTLLGLCQVCTRTWGNSSSHCSYCKRHGIFTRFLSRNNCRRQGICSQ